MANFENPSARYNLHDKDWSDQFGNLTRMLDQYLISANPTSNTATQNYSVPSSQFSVKTDPHFHLNSHDRPVTTSQSPHNNNVPSTTSIGQVLKGNPTIKPSTSPGYPQNQKLTRSQSPPDFFNPYRPQKQVQTERQKIVSPHNFKGRQQNRTEHVSTSGANKKLVHSKSPQNIAQQQAKSNILSALLGHQIDYGPRNRVPYGQAQSMLLSPQADSFCQPPQTYHPQTGYQSQTKIQTSQQYLSTDGSSQKDYWISAANPYAKQKSGQKKTSGNSQQSSLQLSRIYESSHSQVQYGRVANNPPSQRQALKNPTAEFANPSSSTLLSKITQKLSSPSQHHVSTNFESPRSAFTSINDYKVSPRSDIQQVTLGSARAAIYTDQRTPNYLSASVDSMSFQRKNSTEDLVGENQQKLERSVLLSKRAQEQQDPEQQENSFLFNSQDQQAISKIRGSTHMPSSLGVSQIVRESVESERKSHDKETLVYQVVVEYYTDGTRYEGEKQLNKRHGRGRFFYREGYRYEGNWENGCMSGYGTLWSDQNQKVYEGGWQNNVFHGRGTLYNPEPKIKGDFNGTDFRLLKGAWTKFEGLFQAGQKQGLGTLTMANGDVFVGNFARDVVHGRGSYTPKSSQPFIGLWRQNVLIDKY